MNRHFRAPLWQSIQRHRAIAGLLALQVALSAAACANTFAMLSGDLDAMRLPSGMDERALVSLPMPTRGTATPAEDVAKLRSLAGVQDVAVLGGSPFGIDISSRVSALADGSNGVGAGQYQVSAGAIRTLGLRLVAGRDFVPAETDRADGGPAPAVAIVAAALARRLHGSVGAALGAMLYLDGRPLRIVGVVQRLSRGQPSTDAHGDENSFALLLPGSPDPHLGVYMLRVAPADARRVAIEAADAMTALHGQPMDIPGTLADDRSEHFARARADVALLGTATLAFLAVTMIGIFGLSFFWVRKRTVAIGIRRALGARRGAIVAGLVAENAIVVTAGNIAGALLGIAANRWLASHAGIGALPAGHLLAALATTSLAAVAAASIPAFRAASVAPATALRFS